MDMLVNSCGICVNLYRRPSRYSGYIVIAIAMLGLLQVLSSLDFSARDTVPDMTEFTHHKSEATLPSLQKRSVAIHRDNGTLLSRRNPKWHHFNKVSKSVTRMSSVSKESNDPHNKIVNPHLFNYVLNVPDLCDDEGDSNASQSSVLFLIHSAAKNFQERRLIRQSWASQKVVNNTRLQHIFLLADPLDEEIQETVVQEYRNYSDIAQEDFVEHYRNLTHKHLMGYRWVTQFCSRTSVVVKVDDDVFVNVFRLVYYLQNDYKKVSPDSIYCSVYSRMPPRRDKTDKWYVSEDEYPQSFYPPYCEGFAYVIAPQLIVKLLGESMYVRYYWIDDVYVTGFLMDNLKYGHNQFRDPYGYGVMGSGKRFDLGKVDSSLFVLAKYAFRPSLWMQIWDAAKINAANSGRLFPARQSKNLRGVRNAHRAARL